MSYNLSPDATKFVRSLIQYLPGFNSRVAQAWIGNEEGTRAHPLGHENNNNWLNIGYTDSGPKGGVNLPGWKTPEGAAKLTADWIKGTGEMTQAYGKAAPGILDIAKTFAPGGGNPNAQLKAITGSGWASGGESLLRQIYGETVGLHGISSQGTPAQTVSPAAGVGSATAGTRAASTDSSSTGVIPKLLSVFGAMNAQNASQPWLGPVQNAPKAAPIDPGTNALIQQLGQTDTARTLHASTPAIGATMTPSTNPTKDTTPASVISGGLLQGKVIVAPGANRGGVSLQPILLQFIRDVAGHSKIPVTITTGTNHNQYVAGEPGVQSQHWTGNASDIGMGGDARTDPAVAKKGDTLAAHALVAAGLPWHEAVKLAQAGGVHNITPTTGPFKGRRIQVLWKTMVGGNHYDHVHIGIA